MKKNLLLFIIILLAKSSFSQNINLERAIQFDYATYTRTFIYDFSDQTYIIGGLYDDVSSYYFSPPFITKIDSLGNAVWFINPIVSSSDNRASVENMVSSNDSNFIFSGNEMYMCDVGGGFGFVQKLSPQGSIQWVKSFYSTYSYDYFGIALCYLSSNSIRVSDYNKVYHLDSNGDSLTISTYNHSIIRQISETPDHYLLLACDSGLIKTDTTGNVLHTLPLNKIENITCLSSNEYFFNTGATIYKTDSLLNILYQDTLQAPLTSVSEIKQDQNILWLLGHTPYLSKLIKLNDTLGFISDYTFANFNGSDFYAKDIIIHPGEYVLAGGENTYPSYHSFIKSFEKTGNTSNNYLKDAGIISLRTDSAYAIPFFGPIYEVYISMYATVKNFGSSTLNEVYINTNDLLASFCMPSAYCEQFSGLNLLPGDSIEVYIGWLSDYSALVSQNYQYSRCLWTSSPDNKIDIDHTNDKICQAFTITYIVGTENISRQNKITLSPVPCADFLKINLDSKESPVLFTIYDALGKTVLNSILKSGENILPIDYFAKGLYFFKTNSQKFSFAQKFLKE